MRGFVVHADVPAGLARGHGGSPRRAFSGESRRVTPVGLSGGTAGVARGGPFRGVTGASPVGARNDSGQGLVIADVQVKAGRAAVDRTATISRGYRLQPRADQGRNLT